MKKTHIALLIFIAVAIAVLVSYMGDLSTYDTVASARQKEGKFVHLIAKLDKSVQEAFSSQCLRAGSFKPSEPKSW